MAQHQATVDRRVAGLRAAGVDFELACELSNNEFGDLSACVERLSRRGEIDGLYVFADFDWDWNGAGYTCFPQPGAGTRRIADTLETMGWRLYLETVNCSPPRDLAALAENSGGAVIHTAGR